MEIDLLAPRYQVIALWPDSKRFTLGEIIQLEWREHNGKVWGFERTGTPGIWDEEYLKRYPHLFKLLPWWQHRSIKELPLCIKELGATIKVTKVLSWKLVENDLWCTIRHGDEINENKYYQKCIPATEAEYYEDLL